MASEQLLVDCRKRDSDDTVLGKSFERATVDVE